MWLFQLWLIESQGKQVLLTDIAVEHTLASQKGGADSSLKCNAGNEIRSEF